MLSRTFGGRNKKFAFLFIFLFGGFLMCRAQGPSNSKILEIVKKKNIDIRWLVLELKVESRGNGRTIQGIRVYPATVKYRYIAPGFDYAGLAPGGPGMPGKYYKDGEWEIKQEYLFAKNEWNEWGILKARNLISNNIGNYWRPIEVSMEVFYQERIAGKTKTSTKSIKSEVSKTDLPVVENERSRKTKTPAPIISSGGGNRKKHPRVLAQISNVDDAAAIYVNGKEAVSTAWGKGEGGSPIGHHPGHSGWVDITNQMHAGTNQIRLWVWNAAGCCGVSGTFEVTINDAAAISRVFQKQDSQEGVKYDETVPLILDGLFADTTDSQKQIKSSQIEERAGVFYMINSNKPFTGKIVDCYDNGKIKFEGNYLNGKKEGIFITWSEEGYKASELSYKNGKLSGLSTRFYNNRQKAGEENYVDGQKNGLYTTWHENGNKSGEGNFKNDSPEGLWTFWYPNGKKAREGNYLNGSPVGVHTFWDEEGNVTSKDSY